jgi:hypothetical protein
VILHPNASEKVDWLGPIYSNTTGCNNGPDVIRSSLLRSAESGYFIVNETI